MRYLRVESVSELLDALSEDGAVVLAGGTDLWVKLRAGLISPDLLVDITDLKGLRSVSEVDGHVEIGAATPEEDLLASDEIRERLPLLTEVLRHLGAVQIRNRGTLGGNLVNASPAADGAIPLLLYGAELVLTSPSGDRVLPLDRFLVGPGATALKHGEFLRSIRVPIPERPFVSFFHKVGKRRALTISIASVGALFHVEDGTVRAARIAAGSVAPVPLRLRRVEELVLSAPMNDRTIEEAKRLARDSVSPIDDVRASAEYRRTVVADLVAEALRSVVD